MNDSKFSTIKFTQTFVALQIPKLYSPKKTPRCARKLIDLNCSPCPTIGLLKGHKSYQMDRAGHQRIAGRKFAMETIEMDLLISKSFLFVSFRSSFGVDDVNREHKKFLRPQIHAVKSSSFMGILIKAHCVKIVPIDLF